MPKVIMNIQFTILFASCFFLSPGKVKGILNGKDVDPGEYPYAIYAGSCGAVLVSPNTAIGSADCCYSTLRIGAHNLSIYEDVEYMQVVDKVIASDFYEDTLKNNLVILRFNGFSKHRPVELKELEPDEYVQLDKGKELIVLGFGSTKAKPFSNTLKKAVVHHVKYIECRNAYEELTHLNYYERIRRHTVCASMVENGSNREFCSGDEGGPLIDLEDGKLVGLSSWNLGCTNEKYPGVYTNIKYYKEWIDSYINKWWDPKFEKIKYPTSAPTFDKKRTSKEKSNPKVPTNKKTGEVKNLMNITKVPTPIQTTHPLVSLTNGPSKMTNPTKVPLNKKKNKSETTQTNNSAQDQPNCYWTRDVVQETVKNVVEEETTEDRIVKIETVSQRVVYRRSCDTKSLSNHNISNMSPFNFDSQTGAESVDSKNQSPSGSPDNTDELSQIPTKACQSLIETSCPPAKEGCELKEVCNGSGGGRHRLNKTTTKTRTKPKKGGKKTSAPAPRECPTNKGCKWKKVCDPCGFFLSDDNIKDAVKLYKTNPTASNKKYGEVPYWIVKDVTDFNMLFMDNYNFNADISEWDTSGATNMSLMFQKAKTFNQPIGKWKTEKVTAMNAMFEEAHNFNQDVSLWNVDKVKKSAGMFYKGSSFNQDMCPWVNAQTFMDNSDINMIKLTGCDNMSPASKNSFCHDCTACTDDSDCPARSCGTGTCGSAGVCQYTLDSENVLTIKLVTGSFPEDAGFVLTEDGKTVMFANNLSGNVYEWNVDVCAGDHQMCLQDISMSGGHSIEVTYKYTENNVDDTKFPLSIAEDESSNKCVDFTVTAMYSYYEY